MTPGILKACHLSLTIIKLYSHMLLSSPIYNTYQILKIALNMHISAFKPLPGLAGEQNPGHHRIGQTEILPSAALELAFD